MLVRTFEGFSIPEAMRQVKKELGNEAVILATKEKSIDDGRCKVFEVRAAAPNQRSGGESLNKNDKNTLAGITENQLGYRVERIEYNTERIFDTVHRDRTSERIFDELREIKLILADSRLSQSKIDHGDDTTTKELFQQLDLNGLNPEYLRDLSKHLAETEEARSHDPNIKEQPYEERQRTQSIRWMLRRINILPTKTPEKGRTDIHLYVGPSGSGKTSCVAKMAAHYRKIGHDPLLLSFDNQRIGGGESLRLYSKIIGCEHKLIESFSDLNNLLVSQRDRTVVLIDTMGIDARSQTDVTDLIHLTDGEIPIDTHLVLSATDKSLLLDRSISYFGKVGLTSLIFSKLDACWTFGDIFNLSVKWSLPMSFFSTGPKMPDDLERASKERIIERMFGL